MAWVGGLVVWLVVWFGLVIGNIIFSEMFRRTILIIIILLRLATRDRFIFADLPNLRLLLLRDLVG